MKNILFLCTGNSCRSQMAEGWARLLHGDNHNFYSAGIKAHGLNPKAVKVMQESGVDISHHTSKTLTELANINFDIVFTVCGNADETCPAYLKKAQIIHVGFDDPPALEKNANSEEEALDCYRRVRDEIKSFIESLEKHI